MSPYLTPPLFTRLFRLLCGNVIFSFFEVFCRLLTVPFGREDMLELSQILPLSVEMIPVLLSETVGRVMQLWVFPFPPVFPLQFPLLSFQYFPGLEKLYLLSLI